MLTLQQRREQLSGTHFPISGSVRYGAMLLILLLISPMLVLAQAEYTFNPSRLAWVFFIDEGESKDVVFEIRNNENEVLDVSMFWPPELDGLEVVPQSTSILPQQRQSFSMTYTAPTSFDAVRQFLHIQINGNIETFLIDGQKRGTITRDVLVSDIILFGRKLDFGGGKVPAWLILVGAFFITLYILSNVSFTTDKKTTRKRGKKK